MSILANPKRGQTQERLLDLKEMVAAGNVCPGGSPLPSHPPSFSLPTQGVPAHFPKAKPYHPASVVKSTLVWLLP